MGFEENALPWKRVKLVEAQGLAWKNWKKMPI